jgi:hypothetical protein
MAGKTLDSTTEYVRALYIGDPGTGKTTAAAHMAKLGRVLYIDAEGGLKKRPLVQLGVPAENIVMEEARTYEALDDLFWVLRDEFAEDPSAYVGVVFDSTTELVQRFLDQIRRDSYEKHVAKATRRQEDPTITRWFTDRAYYGDMTGQFRELLRNFKDLPCHLCLTALPRRDQDDDGGVTYGPAVNPALQADLMGMVDVIGFTRCEDGVYSAQFVPSKTRQAKDRLGVLPPVMTDPTFDRIVGYVTGDLVNSDAAPAAEETAEASQQQPRTRRTRVRASSQA